MSVLSHIARPDSAFRQVSQPVDCTDEALFPEIHLAREHARKLLNSSKGAGRG